MRNSKALLFFFLFLFLTVQSLDAQTVKSYDPGNHSHLADYILGLVEGSHIFQQSLSAQERLGLVRNFNSWKEHENEVINYTIHQLRFNQEMEIFLTSLGEDYYVVILQSSIDEESKMLYNILVRNITEDMNSISELVNNLLPDYKVDESIVYQIKTLLNESANMNSFSNFTRFIRDQLEKKEKLPPIMANLEEKLYDDDQVFSLLRLKGEAHLITAKKLTGNLFLLQYFQNSTYGPVVHLITLYRDEHRSFIINRGIVAGAGALTFLTTESGLE